jgi:hypothetical protein
MRRAWNSAGARVYHEGAYVLSFSANKTEIIAMAVFGLSAARAQGRSHRARPRLETLETRELLSRRETSIAGGMAAARVDATIASQTGVLSPQSVDQPSLTEAISGGSVNRAPRFYERYRGPRRPDLHVLGAFGRFFYGKGFVFTGTTVGAINSSQSSFYVFGVNRGGATAPGPFPGRPGIIFDAEVIVATSPDGFSGTVELLNSMGQTTSTTSLPNTAVVFGKNHVWVIVPTALLPSTSPPGTAQPDAAYSFAFWAGISPSVPRGIAGFAPKFADQPVVLTGFPPS